MIQQNFKVFSKLDERECMFKFLDLLRLVYRYDQEHFRCAFGVSLNFFKFSRQNSISIEFSVGLVNPCGTRDWSQARNFIHNCWKCNGNFSLFWILSQLWLNFLLILGHTNDWIHPHSIHPNHSAFIYRPANKCFTQQEWKSICTTEGGRVRWNADSDMSKLARSWKHCRSHWWLLPPG